MNCPYCGKEMECGEITSSHGIFWHKDRGPGEHPDTLPLTKFSAKGLLKAMSEGFSANAHRCPACKKIILSHE